MSSHHLMVRCHTIYLHLLQCRCRPSPYLQAVFKQNKLQMGVLGVYKSLAVRISSPYVHSRSQTTHITWPA